MVSRKEMARDDAVPMATRPPPLPASKLPAPLRFPLLVILSLSSSFFLYTFFSGFMGNELAAVSRTVNENWQVASLLGWKILELGIGWYGNFDDLDLVALTILSHAPYVYLLSTFYEISPLTTLLTLGIDTAAIALPIRLLRPRSAPHNPLAPRAAVPNRFIIHDTSVRLLLMMLGTAVYASIMYAALCTNLTVWLATHFDGVRTFERAHAASLQALCVTMWPLGWAAREFLFTPAVGAQSSLGDISQEHFNPATASLAETIAWNFGFGAHSKHSKRARVLALRTAVLVGVAGLNTWVQTYGSLEGADAMGAAGYAALWALAGLVTGGVFGWVGDV
ncbi:hypothetical protein W97_02699 [Coniosporium apollinis CBS 100218]|uniref:Uncharacterized protein n=1 Tax=Coniosporium apollinis (strain CBS 100218) TaxID=1168221 RepID=R7YP68_CONA1|nr:uncharacterized protein W97_02699 [Coniosporium apollinis CBS 100218]EON63471.1 hypothetical protein W97_02699 [Coniosporium apollinis CBS 100218]